MAQGIDVDKLMREARKEGYTLVLDKDGRTLRWANLVGEFDPSIELSMRVAANRLAIVERLWSEKAPSNEEPLVS